ncbi:hypothetical protein BCV70DRAFT_67157 [Testicularia cyperi]|uniref:Uncharacterized protein n=1 Tax=Testicularia cyperi TaxID=1882483 RepID=A0A317XHK5_9BASI|nr:hypothetical protein BCV70DRAFT_67157 [Testicularia cyperi]
MQAALLAPNSIPNFCIPPPQRNATRHLLPSSRPAYWHLSAAASCNSDSYSLRSLLRAAASPKRLPLSHSLYAPCYIPSPLLIVDALRVESTAIINLCIPSLHCSFLFCCCLLPLCPVLCLTLSLSHVDPVFSSFSRQSVTTSHSTTSRLLCPTIPVLCSRPAYSLALIRRLAPKATEAYKGLGLWPQSSIPLIKNIIPKRLWRQRNLSLLYLSSPLGSTSFFPSPNQPNASSILIDTLQSLSFSHHLWTR